MQKDCRKVQTYSYDLLPEYYLNQDFIIFFNGEAVSYIFAVLEALNRFENLKIHKNVNIIILPLYS